MYSLIRAVFDFLVLYRDKLKLADREFEPLFETALQQELNKLLLLWLKQPLSDSHVEEVSIATTAQVISWAIFGPAVQWSRGNRVISLEETIQGVLSFVIAGLSPVIKIF